MFVITSMPVGGAETLLVQLIRRMDRSRVSPELCCLKYLGPLGEAVQDEIPTFSGLLTGKYDFGVLWRLARLMRQRRIDAVVTVGTGGDKMFWGRLAGWLAGVPVICSALHSSGLPDRVELLNRLLAPITDAFIAVAETHRRYLAANEGCPANKLRVVPNGVDVELFKPAAPPADDPPRLLYVGTLAPWQGVDTLFVAVKKLLRTHAVELTMLGSGRRSWVKHYQKLARRMHIDHAVEFVPSLPHEQVPAAIAAVASA